MNSDAALNSVIIPETKSSKSHFHISCHLKGHHRTVKVAAMVDSGATSLFIDHKFAKQHRMVQQILEHPITLYNIDGSWNEAGSITHKVTLLLKVGQDEEKFDFYVTSLGPERVILGLPWLRHRNPQINWHKVLRLDRTSAWLRRGTIRLSLALLRWGFSKGLQPMFDKRWHSLARI